MRTGHGLSITKATENTKMVKRWWFLVEKFKRGLTREERGRGVVDEVDGGEDAFSPKNGGKMSLKK